MPEQIPHRSNALIPGGHAGSRLSIPNAAAITPKWPAATQAMDDVNATIAAAH
jgi:hypothetical protein